MRSPYSRRAGAGDSGDDGGDSDFAKESASAIEKASIEDMKALEAVHMEGEVTQQGSEIGLDLSLTTDGDCTGTVSRGDSGSAEVVTLDGTSYVQARRGVLEGAGGPRGGADHLHGR